MQTAQYFQLQNHGKYLNDILVSLISGNSETAEKKSTDSEIL